MNGSTPPPGEDEPPGAEVEDPPTSAVVVVFRLVLDAPEVEVAPEVLVAPEVELPLVVVVSPEVLVEGFVVVVVPGGWQPVTQKTLCLTSAPLEPSALTVSFTWKPWFGWGSIPVKSRV